MFSLLHVIPAFALTALLLAMVPGQGVAMVLRQSLVGGRSAAFYSLAGNAVGLITWGLLSSVGLSVIFAKSKLAFALLKWAGVTFLVILSIQTLIQLRNEFGKFDFDSSAKTQFWPAFRLGLITNLTNVKAALFAVAFIPQFVPKSVPLGLGIIVLSCTQSLVSTTWYTSMILAVHKSSVVLAKPSVRRALTAVSALGIMFLALGLALTSPR